MHTITKIAFGIFLKFGAILSIDTAKYYLHVLSVFNKRFLRYGQKTPIPKIHTERETQIATYKIHDTT